MDKYQEILLEKGKTFCVFAEDEDESIYNTFISDKYTLRQINEKLTDYRNPKFRAEIKLIEPIILKQLEDITKKKYFLFIHNQNFKDVYYIKNCNKISAFSKNGEGLTAFGIKLDFEDKISEITIEFKNDMADPLTLSLKFIDADKDAYYDKIKQSEQQDKLSKLNVSHSCGNDLVTIKFQNCCEDVTYTQILLYDDKKQPMGVFKVDKGMFYKSITNLAYGKYFYKVEQFNKDNNLIVSTDYIEFRISAPYYGKNIVCN